MTPTTASRSERPTPEHNRSITLSLLGGPLHWLGVSIGLVRHNSNTVPLGIALAAVAWLVLVALALVEQAAGQIFSLAVIGGHVRLLLVIPASATFAEGIVAGTSSMSMLHATLLALLLINALLFLAPMCILCPKLWQCRVAAFQAYGELTSRYISEFKRKWVTGPGRGTGATTATGEPLLGSPDVSGLIDLSCSFVGITKMRLFPGGLRLRVLFAAATVLPMLPLLLFEFPITELSERIFKMVFSL